MQRFVDLLLAEAICGHPITLAQHCAPDDIFGGGTPTLLRCLTWLG